MILAIDVGNSHIVIGCVEGEKVLFTERIATNRSKTELEYAIDFKLILEFHRLKPEQVNGSIISTVVPPLSNILKKAVAKILGSEPLVVGPGVKNGLTIRIDNPAQLGSDLVVGAVAVLAQYPMPAIIIDMGTATTFSVINEKKQFLGGAIVPGTQVALNSLASVTSQLPQISLEAPKHVVGSNTIDSMKSGAVFGTAALIDGMIDRINEELGSPAATIIATGGLAKYIIPHCRAKILYDDDLMMKGLSLIYQKNQA